MRGLSTVMKSGPRLLQLEKALAQKQRPNTAKKKKSQVKKNQIRFVFIPNEMKIRENSENDFKV